MTLSTILNGGNWSKESPIRVFMHLRFLDFACDLYRFFQYMFSRSVRNEERLLRMTNQLIKYDWMLVEKFSASGSQAGDRLDRGCNMLNG